jgi:hypothetical protein
VIKPRSLPAAERWINWYVGAGLVAFVAAAIGPSLVGRNTLLSVNILTGHFPWLAGGSQITGHQLCSGDTIDSGMPGIAYIRSQLASGHLPNWQNLVAGGSPLGSQPNLALLNPLSLPYFIMPLWLAPAFVKLLQLGVAIGGMYLFMRRHSAGRAASMLAGFTFAVSGFMVMWTNWSQVQVAAFIPALFWATERLIQRARVTDAIPVALVVGWMLLGGFPAVTGWALYAAGAYLLVRLLTVYRQERPELFRRLGIAAGGLALGVMLSMIQLLPFALEYRSENHSFRAGLSHAPLPFGGLLTLVAPDANGLCIAGRLTYGKWSSIELVAYIGSAALVLAVLGMAAGRRRFAGRAPGVRTYLVVAVFLVLLLGWGGGYALRLVDYLPVVSGNLVGRIRALLGFLLAVLAGFGFDALLRARRQRPPDAKTDAKPDAKPDAKRDAARPVLVTAACALIGGAVLWSASRDARALGFGHVLERRIWLPVLLVVVSLACVALVYRRRPALSIVALYVLPLLMFAQGFQFFHTVLPGDNPKNFYPVTATHRFLDANLGEDSYAATAGVMYPATAMYYGMRTVTGHTYHEPQWQLLLQALDPQVMESSTFSQFSSQTTVQALAESKILDRMSAKYLVAGPGELTGTFAPFTHGAATVEVGPGQQAQCSLPAGGLRGVSVWVADAWIAADLDEGLTLTMTVTAGGRTVTSGRFLGSGVPAGTGISIATAAESLPAGAPVTVTVSGSGAAGPLVLAGRSAATAGGPAAIDCAAIRPANDGLKLAYADAGSIVYERLSALPRIRWASAAVTITDPTQRIATLQAGIPDDAVLLSSAGAAPAGQPAAISVGADSGSTVSAVVDAQGAGYLVVADALQDPGWSVSVDGKPADLVLADDAMGAVLVSQGVHRVVFSYRARGQTAGAALTALAIILMIGLALGQRFRWFHYRLLGPRSRAEAQPDES